MKHLYIIRHAKSDRPENVKDFDRPLAQRGYDDAQKMAEFILSKQIKIDKFISSPANRALTTCDTFARAYKNDNIETVERLYSPRPKDFTNTIEKIDDRYEAVAIFSHNDGLTLFANELDKNITQVPTCGVVGFEINAESWADFEKAAKKLACFFYPKML